MPLNLEKSYFYNKLIQSVIFDFSMLEKRVLYILY